jgi:hypothetical protein
MSGWRTHLKNSVNVDLVRVRNADEGSVGRPRLKRCHCALHSGMLVILRRHMSYHEGDLYKEYETYQRQDSESVEDFLLGLTLFGEINHALRATEGEYSVPFV